jgi:PTH1 family peptidyl-tRNA hydrolase
MKVIVGLGNPGDRYAGTRHNVGYAVVDYLSAGTPFQHRFQAEIAERTEEGEKVFLVKPLSFMNLSGRVVREVMDFYKAPIEDLLVVCDDFNLPLGKIRARAKGSDGGHNGLRDIENHLATTSYSRLRIGVGSPEEGKAVDFVLGRFSPGERPVIEDAIARAGQGAVVWMKQGIQVCMNQYNG